MSFKSNLLQFERKKTFKHVPLNLGYDDLATVEVDGRRQYIIPTSGLKFQTFPSITTVLGHRKKPGLEAWKKFVGETEAKRISTIACNRGQCLHSIVERYIENESAIFEKTDMPDSIAMFEALEETLNLHVDQIRLQEKPLFSEHLRVAGRVDLIAEYDGTLAIIDFKTSSRVKTAKDIKDYYIQECAYAIMFEERTKIPITKLVTLMTVVGQKKPLIFIEDRDRWVPSLLAIIEDYEKTLEF